MAPPGSGTWHDADEYARLERMVDAAARHRRSVAWRLRRWALSRACPEVDEAEWRFRPGPNGKPELAAPFDRLGLHHNLSHGGAYAAVLIADLPCGVDVEPQPEGIGGSDVVFGPAERADIAAHPRPAERFGQHWVAKEAALKLMGTGFLAAPEAIILEIAPDGLSARQRLDGASRPRLPADATFRLWFLPGGHWLAAALSGSAVVRPAWPGWVGETR